MTKRTKTTAGEEERVKRKVSKDHVVKRNGKQQQGGGQGKKVKQNWIGGPQFR